MLKFCKLFVNFSDLTRIRNMEVLEPGPECPLPKTHSMGARIEELVRQQAIELQSLREVSLDLARSPGPKLDDDAREALRELSRWLEARSNRVDQARATNPKAALTRLRLLCLQVESCLQQLRVAPNRSRQLDVCQKLSDLVESVQRRDLYNDMTTCLRELSTISIERGIGRQAVLYREMAQKLEARLESGQIDLDDYSQRDKDEALYAELREKLETMKE